MTAQTSLQPRAAHCHAPCSVGSWQDRFITRLGHPLPSLSIHEASGIALAMFAGGGKMNPEEAQRSARGNVPTRIRSRRRHRSSELRSGRAGLTQFAGEAACGSRYANFHSRS